MSIERAPDKRAPEPSLSPFAGLSARIADRSAIVAVVGLGYVGLPLLVAAGAEGFGLIGLDTDPVKVRSLRDGRSHVADVADDEVRLLGRAQFSTDHRVLVAADAILIAVPTPLRQGSPDLSAVTEAASRIAPVLRPGQLVVLESTTYPGTTEELLRPLLEKSGLVAGRDFALAYSPERIDPGGGRSFRHTPKVVAGLGPADTEVAIQFYDALVDRVVRTSSPRAAEMAKLVENTFPSSTSPWSTSWPRSPPPSAWTSGRRSTPPPPSRSATCPSGRGLASGATASPSTPATCRGRWSSGWASASASSSTPGP